MPAIAGIMYLYVNGEQQWAEGDFEVNLGLPKREDAMATHGRVGYVEEPQAATVSGNILLRADMDLKALLSSENVPVTVELSNGVSIVLPAADQHGTGVLNPRTGRIAIEFHGNAAEVNQS